MSRALNILDNIALFDGLIFTSMHAVRSLDFYPKNIASDFQGVVFSVGEVTAKALKDYGFKTIIHPEIETVTALVEYIKMAQCNKFLYLAGRERKKFLETTLLTYDLTVKVYKIKSIAKLSHSQINKLLKPMSHTSCVFKKTV